MIAYTNKIQCDISRMGPALYLEDEDEESPAIADKPARRLRKVCTVYVRAVGL